MCWWHCACVRHCARVCVCLFVGLGAWICEHAFSTLFANRFACAERGRHLLTTAVFMLNIDGASTAGTVTYAPLYGGEGVESAAGGYCSYVTLLALSVTDASNFTRVGCTMNASEIKCSAMFSPRYIWLCHLPVCRSLRCAATKAFMLGCGVVVSVLELPQIRIDA